jgi:hypothetical protein
MTRTSRLRRLHVVEPSPKHDPGQHEKQELPASVDEVPPPDSADAADLDARLTGMVTLLRVALRLMRSHDASPSRREHGR